MMLCPPWQRKDKIDFEAATDSMAPFFVRAATVSATLMFCAAAKEVHWYLASGNTEGNAVFLKQHG